MEEHSENHREEAFKLTYETTHLGIDYISHQIEHSFDLLPTKFPGDRQFNKLAGKYIVPGSIKAPYYAISFGINACLHKGPDAMLEAGSELAANILTRQAIHWTARSFAAPVEAALLVGHVTKPLVKSTYEYADYLDKFYEEVASKLPEHQRFLVEMDNPSNEYRAACAPFVILGHASDIVEKFEHTVASGIVNYVKGESRPTTQIFSLPQPNSFLLPTNFLMPSLNASELNDFGKFTTNNFTIPEINPISKIDMPVPTLPLPKREINLNARGFNIPPLPSPPSLSSLINNNTKDISISAGVSSVIVAFAPTNPVGWVLGAIVLTIGFFTSRKKEKKQKHIQDGMERIEKADDKITSGYNSIESQFNNWLQTSDPVKRAELGNNIVNGVKGDKQFQAYLNDKLGGLKNKKNDGVKSEFITPYREHWNNVKDATNKMAEIINLDKLDFYALYNKIETLADPNVKQFAKTMCVAKSYDESKDALSIGNIVRAQQISMLGLQINPEYAPLLTIRGLSTADSNPQQAYADYQKAIQIDTQNVAAYLGLFDLQLKNNEFDNASNTRNIIKQKFPREVNDESISVLNNKFNQTVSAHAFELIKLGKGEEALRLIQNSSYSINQSDVAFIEGYYHFEQKAWDKAILKFEEQIKIDPTNGQAKPLLAESYRQSINDCYEKKDYSTAISKLLRLLELDPQDKNIHKSIGKAYRLQGNDEAAKAYYESVLEKDPMNIEIQEEYSNLKQQMQDIQIRKTEIISEITLSTVALGLNVASFYFRQSCRAEVESIPTYAPVPLAKNQQANIDRKVFSQSNYRSFFK